jgi:hypothetical protein
MFGFTLGVQGFYDSNIFGGGSDKVGARGAGFSPSVFANFSSRKYVFHVDGSYTYRNYLHHSELNANVEGGALEFLYQPTRRLHFSVHGSARGGTNDFLSYAGAGLGMQGTNLTGAPLQTFFNPMHMFTGSAMSDVSFESSRNNTLSASAQYTDSRYSQQQTANTNQIVGQARDSYKVSTKWSLDFQAQGQWIGSDTGITSGRTESLSGGLSYQAPRGWGFSCMVGDQRVHSGFGVSDGTTAQLSATRSSERNRFSVHYSRSAGYQLGLSGLNKTDSFDAGFDRSFSRRVSFHLASRYYRTLGVSLYGGVDTAVGSAGWEIALSPSLVASLSANYMNQNQKTATVAALSLNADRYMVVVGVVYSFPSARPRSRAPQTAPVR